jgi:hypothetical protein
MQWIQHSKYGVEEGWSCAVPVSDVSLPGSGRLELGEVGGSGQGEFRLEVTMADWDVYLHRRNRSRFLIQKCHPPDHRTPC